MGTVTISKAKYETLKREAAAYRRIVSAPKAALHTIVHTPNKKILRAIQTLRAGKGHVYSGSTKDIFDTLLKER